MKKGKIYYNTNESKIDPSRLLFLFKWEWIKSFGGGVGFEFGNRSLGNAWYEKNPSINMFFLPYYSKKTAI